VAEPYDLVGKSSFLLGFCSGCRLDCWTTIVTHKGAEADARHYIGYVKKSVFHAKSVDVEAEDDEDWCKFDDDKVSVFPKEKLGMIDRGGEDSFAYVLLYRSRWDGHTRYC
jgi:ubiquitin carboxyl-terminal hydrolase 14